jgi:peroxiredoxin Q/BCP
MAQSLTEGAKAPEIVLNNADGKKVKLSDFKGKQVVLYFYPRDNTPGCTLEGRDFSALLPQFKKKNAVVIGVSPDSEKSHCGFIKKHGLTVELLSDPEHAVLEKYGVWQEKSLYGKKHMGVVRTTFLIDANGIIKKIWNKVKVNNHAQEVLESL